MTNAPYMPASKSSAWETPMEIFQWCSLRYGTYDLDVAASKSNAMCKRYITEERDALSEGTHWVGTVWCNPPYGRGLGLWVEKAVREYYSGAARSITMLLPARTDTKWFHDHCYFADDISLAEVFNRSMPPTVHFLRGRLGFLIDGKPVLDAQGRAMKAPFPSMIVVWR